MSFHHEGNKLRNFLPPKFSPPTSECKLTSPTLKISIASTKLRSIFCRTKRTVLRQSPMQRPARRVALRGAEGTHKVEAPPLLKIGPRLRGATIGDTTFGLVAEGARRQDYTCAGAKAKDERRGCWSSLTFSPEAEDTRR